MAKFNSKCPNQILTIKPARQQVLDGVVMPVPGERICFYNGEYETTDKKEIEYIRKHRLFGNSIVEVKSSDTEQATAQ